MARHESKHAKEWSEKAISPKDLEQRCKPVTANLLSTQRNSQDVYIHENDVANKIPLNLTHPPHPYYRCLPWMCRWELMCGRG